MRRTARTLENALSILSGVLDRQLDCSVAFYRHGAVARLVVAHAVAHTFPRAFFVPNTECLLQPYKDLLDFLVGDLGSDATNLVRASSTLKWHEHAEPMPDRRSTRTRLTTPPEVLKLLAGHSDTVAVMAEIFTAARLRLEKHNTDVQAQTRREAKLAADTAEAVQHLLDTGGTDLVYAVYRELKKIYD